MFSKANILIGAVIAAGWIELVRNLVFLHSDDPARFLVYFIVSLLVSGLKLRLPGITGTISVCFVFVLIGIVSLNLPQVLLAGCSAVLVQYFWQAAKRLRLIQVLFNIASTAIAISLSYRTFHSEWLRSLPLELSVMLALLGCSYFVTTSGLVAAVIAATESKSFFAVWRTSYLWAFPYYLLGSATAGLFSIAQKHLGWQTSMLVVPVVYLVYRSYRLHLGRLEEQKKHAEETAALHLRTIESLALAIEAKDHTTHDHLQRVQVYAVEIAKELKLGETELQAVRAASLLHDIGKIAVPEHIICKPGKLTPEEFEKMKIHPVVGAEILARAQFPYPVAPIVHSHHEKWDGTGYPDGLKGTEIPIGARILSAVDFLDALASDRQYRRALPLGKAMEMALEQSGKAFDPMVIAILQKRYVELEQLARCSQVESLSLSTDIKIHRGAAPDAGFEEASTPHAVSKPSVTNTGASWREMADTLQLLSGVVSAKDAFAIFACRLQELVPADCIAIYSRSGDTLKTQFAWGARGEVLRQVELLLGEGVSGWVAANGKPILNGNPLADLPEFPDLQSALAVPIGGEARDSRVVVIYSTKADAFTAAHLRDLMALGPVLGRLTEKNELQGLALAMETAAPSRAIQADLLPV